MLLQHCLLDNATVHTRQGEDGVQRLIDAEDGHGDQEEGRIEEEDDVSPGVTSGRLPQALASRP